MQVNGKMRGKVEVPAGDKCTQDMAMEAARADDGVAKYLEARRGPEPHFAAFVAAGVI